jgi:hypothetical protein
MRSFADGPEGPVISKEFHRFVECMGCENTKYVISSLDVLLFDAEEEILKVYPDAPGTPVRRKPTIGGGDIRYRRRGMLVPEPVWKMYMETIAALNANILTLAGGGLRAVVEAICLDKEIVEGNLQKKIGELSNQNLLTKAQADLLHEERYLGNAALHEMATPTQSDIEDGLGIVEGLINTIYIIPSKAKRLKDRREAKSKAPRKRTRPSL